MTADHQGPLAVLSCIHGNLAALEAVLLDVRQRGIEQIVCLGDLVGYGPDPNPVVERIREERIPVVQGCWDEGIARAKGDCGCVFATQEDAVLGELAYTWTDLEVNEETRTYLGALPRALGRRCVAGDIAFVHGSPASNAEYLQDTTHELVLMERAARAGCDVLVCGHTHVPFVRRISGTLSSWGQDEGDAARHVALKQKIVVNAGSVGEPRHGRPHATYVILDQSNGKVIVREVAYDVQATLRRLERAGLPPEFGERLAGGQELVGKRKDIACSC